MRSKLNNSRNTLPETMLYFVEEKSVTFSRTFDLKRYLCAVWSVCFVRSEAISVSAMGNEIFHLIKAKLIRYLKFPRSYALFPYIMAFVTDEYPKSQQLM